jgi:hypothetical protein
MLSFGLFPGVCSLNANVSENIRHTKHGESLKSRTILIFAAANPPFSIFLRTGRFIALLSKARYSNHLERNKTITHNLFLFFKLPSSLPAVHVAAWCHLYLPNCIGNFLAFTSVIIPSPIILFDFNILIGYFWQRKEISIFKKCPGLFWAASSL